MKAVIYARYSSDNQREESITAQIRACTEYAERNGYSIIKIYTDEAKSAQTDDRPGFLKMMSEIKGNLVRPDFLIVHKIDRFARNRYDSAFYKRELRKAGVLVQSVLEHLDDSPESIILESVLEGMAEYYSKNLAREVMKGMRETALKAKHTGGLPPLGFDVDKDKNYIINESEAPAVRMIFEMRDAGHGYNSIRDALHKQGYKTKLGKPFGKNSLHEILRNKKYIGTYVFNRSTSKTPDGKRNNHLSKSSEEVIEIPNAIPAIIPESLFWKVQNKMNQNKKLRSTGGHKAKVVYLLSGLIWCGVCGKRMVGSSSTYKTRVTKETRQRHYYLCNNADRTKTCINKKINKHTIEEYVINKLEQGIFSEEAMPRLAEKLYAHYSNIKKETAGEGDYLKKELDKVDRQIKNIVDAIAEGTVVIRAFAEKLKSLENEKATLENRYQEWLFKQQEEIVSKEKILEVLNTYRQALNSDDPLVVKQVIERFVKDVKINTDTIEVNLMVSVHTTGGGGGS
ncbi:recombinase family protein [Desulfotruncus alcoholivorax]|uniref:recombinase family protein n=1 Tax=Desulfotruncus alcoholivorax TaxID=265477 RepID=UPI00041A2D4B|nr:recombinase family protein [Desulfotruncus alcoholivorax]